MPSPTVATAASSRLFMTRSPLWLRTREEPERDVADTTSVVLEVCEEVYRYAVRVAKLCISLSPEGVPRPLVAFAAAADHPGIELVDRSRALASEGEARLVAGPACPVGS